MLFLNHFLVALFVVLQWTAPLVHAHTHHAEISGGLHIPGLEQLTIARSDNIACLRQTQLPEGLLVSIGQGIESHKTTLNVVKAIFERAFFLHAQSAYRQYISRITLNTHLIASESTRIRAPPHT